MFMFRSSSDSSLRSARRARWVAGGALNLFALALIVTEVLPSWRA